MATPKKRTGKASQATRRANWKGSIPATTTCPNCKAIVLTHTVCPECGYYKDGFASKKVKANKVEKIESKPEEIKEAEVVAETKTEEKAEVKKTTTRKPRAKKADGEAKTTTTRKPRAKKSEATAEKKSEEA